MGAMVDFGYLYKGLCGLARAHRANAMAGHLGAAVVAGYFFGEEHPDLDPSVTTAVEHELDRIVQGGETLWYDPKAAGITVPELFEPFPEERGKEELIPKIAEALSVNIGETRQSGHNVIFASIALRALHDHPQYATPTIVGGVVKLINGFNNAVSGRGYYGKKRGWIVGNKVSLPPDDFHAYAAEQNMADVVIEELIRSASVRRQGFGGLFHIINHATGLTELSRFGYRKLASKGLAAHHHHVRLWRSLPDVEDELGPLKKATHDPRTPEYWRDSAESQWSARLTHRVKTLYGFYSLLRFVEDLETRAKAEDQFRYLMA
jgi:hypothetical protein